MEQSSAGVWRCLTHQGPEWETARAMGAQLPCRIPTTHGGLDHIVAETQDWPTFVMAVRQAQAEGVSLTYAISRRRTVALLDRVLDEMSDLRGAALKHPECPSEVRHRAISEYGDTLLVQTVMATDPDIPVGLMEAITQHPHHWARQQLAKNPMCPDHILKTLAADHHVEVRTAAVTALAGRGPVHVQ